MIICTLTLVNDTRAVYEDSLLHRRADNNHVEGSLGGNVLTRETAHLLSRWVAAYDDSCRRAELQILGRHLYEIAFGGQPADSRSLSSLGAAFEKTYGVFREQTPGKPLRLRLVVGADVRELATLPWEFLYMPWEGSGFFLAGERTRLILTRYVPNSDRQLEQEDDEDDSQSLRILIVKSGPNAPGLGIVDADEVVKQVQELQSDTISVQVLDSPSRSQLRDHVNQWQPHIVHLIGHGKPGSIALRADNEEIERRARARALQRDLGHEVDPVDEADWVDSQSVCTLLRQGLDEHGGPGRLVFLHACNGATPEFTAKSLEGFNSVARALAQSERIAAVVAMQYEILNTDATRFASEFYSRLAEQLPVDEAVTAARRELGEISNRGHQAWDDRSFGTPVVYLRSEDPLFRRVRGALRQPKPAAPEQPEIALKAPCPNPYCRPDVYVFRKKGWCDVCKQPFVPCPKPDCVGLITPEPGMSCYECGYTFEGIRGAGAGYGEAGGAGESSARPANPTPVDAHVSERPRPPDRPGGGR